MKNQFNGMSKKKLQKLSEQINGQLMKIGFENFPPKTVLKGLVKEYKQASKTVKFKATVPATIHVFPEFNDTFLDCVDVETDTYLTKNNTTDEIKSLINSAILKMINLEDKLKQMAKEYKCDFTLLKSVVRGNIQLSKVLS
jgi:hypothetical protein